MVKTMKLQDYPRREDIRNIVLTMLLLEVKIEEF